MNIQEKIEQAIADGFTTDEETKEGRAPVVEAGMAASRTAEGS